MSAKLKNLKIRNWEKWSWKLCCLWSPCQDYLMTSYFVQCSKIELVHCTMLNSPESHTKNDWHQILWRHWQVLVRLCLTNYTKHPVCKSVNYNRPQKLCEISSTSLNWNRGMGALRNNLINAMKLNHLDTRKYSKLFSPLI